MIGIGMKGIISRLAGSINSVRQASTVGFLAPNSGSTHNFKRVGRGPASGKGRTAGRGHKGQKARGKVPHWMEGGQTPYYKRFPVFGFTRPHAEILSCLNLIRIQEFWDNGRIPLKTGETLTIKVMKDCGLVTGNIRDGVRILGIGKDNYNVPLNIEASKATAQAIEAIEKTGKTFTAFYFTKLSLRAHLNPEKFLLKFGYIPLPARPTHKKVIQYYSNEEKRGYLLKDRSILLDHFNKDTTKDKANKVSTADILLEKVSDKPYPEFTEAKIITI